MPAIKGGAATLRPALTLHDDTGKWGSVNIHPSRMVRLIGLDPPDPMSNYGWGDPLMQMINDAVSAAGTVQQSIAAMIGEAKFDVSRYPGSLRYFLRPMARSA